MHIKNNQRKNKINHVSLKRLAGGSYMSVVIVLRSLKTMNNNNHNKFEAK